MNANFICLEDKAFYILLDKVVEHIKQNHFLKEDKWISGEEAMKKLRITSKTTLQKYRARGVLGFLNRTPVRSYMITIQSTNT